jgi:hypothetical protein
MWGVTSIGTTLVHALRMLTVGGYGKKTTFRYEHNLASDVFTVGSSLLPPFVTLPFSAMCAARLHAARSLCRYCNRSHVCVLLGILPQVPGPVPALQT